ncbi:MAG: alkaline phosphatase PafA [Balneolaceae bacterium]
MRFLSSTFSLLIMAALFVSAYDLQSENTNEKVSHDPPDLVVGIMVDQMRPDFIYRYWDKFGDDGFKRLINEGFSFKNAHFDYMPTATGPGHAGVYTGTTPSVHGAMGNSWYVRELDRSINVIEVPGYEGVGSVPDSDESKGPSNMLTSTVGDELRLHTNNRSKVVGISRKDRGAILPAGHTGDAYWYESATGNFVTSTYYTNELPSWVQEFNDRSLAQEYLSEPWETLLPMEDYIESIDDDNPYERMFDGQDAPVFPHDLPTLVEEYGYDPGLLSSTPFGDKLLTELAMAAIEGEQLGRGPTTDMLAISYSAPDAIGHRYGPASKEAQDMYLRLDRYIADLLGYLDKNFGKDNILLFLTSDHGAVHVPAYLADQGLPAKYFDTSAMLDSLREHLKQTYGYDLVSGTSNFEIFLDREHMDRVGLDHEEVQKNVARFLQSVDGVAGALTAETLINSEFTQGIRAWVQNGFNMNRSGDVAFWLEPMGYPGSGPQGTGHGSPWVYDTHAPLYWFGKDVPQGQTSHPVFISDIASTVATFLNSPFPSGNTGNPMNDFMK